MLRKKRGGNCSALNLSLLLILLLLLPPPPSPSTLHASSLALIPRFSHFFPLFRANKFSPRNAFLFLYSVARPSGAKGRGVCRWIGRIDWIDRIDWIGWMGWMGWMGWIGWIGWIGIGGGGEGRGGVGEQFHRLLLYAPSAWQSLCSAKSRESRLQLIAFVLIGMPFP
jgi:hypothetical protein